LTQTAIFMAKKDRRDYLNALSPVSA